MSVLYFYYFEAYYDEVNFLDDQRSNVTLLCSCEYHQYRQVCSAWPEYGKGCDHHLEILSAFYLGYLVDGSLSEETPW